MSKQATLLSFFGRAAAPKPKVEAAPNKGNKDKEKDESDPISNTDSPKEPDVEVEVEVVAASAATPTQERKRLRTGGLTLGSPGAKRAVPVTLQGLLPVSVRQPAAPTLDEDTLERHRAHLSPTLGADALASTWEFACVLDFFSRFADEVDGARSDCLAQHKRRERQRWAREERTRYDEETLRCSVSFSAAGLAAALVGREDGDRVLMADIHVALLKGLHPRAKNPPCRMNWLQFVARHMADSWPKVCLNQDAPQCFFIKKNGEAEEAYWAMDAVHRLRALRFLCEVASDLNARITSRVEQAKEASFLPLSARDVAKKLGPDDKGVAFTLRPGGKQKKTLMVTGQTEFVDSLRQSDADHFATDHYRREYMLLRLRGAQGSCFLVRTARAVTAVGQGGGEGQGEPAQGECEVVCASGEEFVSFVANHVDTKLFGGKARSRFRDLVVELEAELEAEQKARRVRKELGGNPFAGHAMAARTEDGRRRSGRNRAAPARYGVESTTTSEESESEDEDEVSSSSSGGEGSGDEAGSQRADADFSVSEGESDEDGDDEEDEDSGSGSDEEEE